MSPQSPPRMLQYREVSVILSCTKYCRRRKINQRTPIFNFQIYWLFQHCACSKSFEQLEDNEALLEYMALKYLSLHTLQLIKNEKHLPDLALIIFSFQSGHKILWQRNGKAQNKYSIPTPTLSPWVVLFGPRAAVMVDKLDQSLLQKQPLSCPQNQIYCPYHQ